MTEDINEKLAKAMGECWHEKGDRGCGGYHCKGCGDVYRNIEWEEGFNPSYTTNADDLLRLVEWGLNNDVLINRANAFPETFHMTTCVVIEAKHIIERDDQGRFTLPGKIAEAMEDK